MTEIMTVGYEGASPDAFDATLFAARVDCVVDVRAVAISRRKGFSKTALSERIRSSGVEYVHLKGLGDPKPGRDAARAGNWQTFRSIFFAHMKTAEAQRDLAVLGELVTDRRVALLCYEADHAQCHRTIVAALLASHAKLKIVHLMVDGRGGTIERSRASNHTGESLAAA